MYLVNKMLGKITIYLVASKSFENSEKFKYLGTTAVNKAFTKKLKSTLISSHACYHFIQSLLSGRLLPENLKIKMYKTLMLPVFCMVVKLGLLY
jgi:hypothetical protein